MTAESSDARGGGHADLDVSENDIAIVGMAGRFPGADDADELWRNVASSADCLTDFDLDDLIERGERVDLVRSPDYVARGGQLMDVAGFDPSFFGIGARDGAIMDPQHRHFLECSWEALESAAIVPETFDGAIGIFGGCGMNTYLVNNLLTDPNLLDSIGWFLLRHTGNDKDFFVNNVAYRLNLTGPAVNVQTACSTSLVAVHLAVQSLLSFECDAALAGGATIEVPHGVGYEFREGEILSADGRCRAFDAASGGTVLTSGAGAVVLRRLSDALDAGDPLLAVIRGTAINNDGSRKVSFLAPSVDGHADVVREALTVADLSARDLQLIEAHGTGTPVGDPIEVAALTEAFRTWTADTGFCRLTSTKPNIGHLDTAAGVASLIKVVQALRHATLPGLANHTGPSELLGIESTPFVVTGESSPWPGDVPRRAGISSLGVGGTNAHVVVEEAPTTMVEASVDREHALVLSARTPTALDGAAQRLADHLESHPSLALDDVAATLLNGRRPMEHRRVLVARTTAAAVETLRTPDRHRSHADRVDSDVPGLGFMFPGGGAQYAGMGAGLDERYEVFHDVRRDGAAMVRDHGGPDLLPLFEVGGDAGALELPTASLPAVFVTSLALARQCQAFGIEASVYLGHSLGEYVAAHLAGVMSFEDVVRLVVVRSSLMQRAAGDDAAMLAVPLAEDEVRALVPDEISVATVNASDECVVAGRRSDVEAFAHMLAERDAAGTMIPLLAAAHSSLLDPVLDEFREAIATASLSAPKVRYPSNLTGTWITDDQATSADYWVDHLRGTVRFHDCLTTVLGEAPHVLMEVGPGQGLSSYARRTQPRPRAVIPALRHHDHDIDDSAYTTQAVAKLWSLGLAVDLDALIAPRRRRLRLPTYAFDHDRCWIEPGRARQFESETDHQPATAISAIEPLERIDAIDDATWIPTWTDIEISRAEVTGSWLLVGDVGDPLIDQLGAELAVRGADVSVRGPIGADLDDGDGLDAINSIVVVASADASYGAAAQRWLDDGTRLVREAGRRGARFSAITRSALPVGGASDRPGDALALGPVMVAPREYLDLVTHLVDVGDSAQGGSVDVGRIVDALHAAEHRVVAIRGDGAVVPSIDRTAVEAADAPAFRSGGTYVVTGGLGGVGHVIASHLLTTYDAQVAVTVSAALPAPADRDEWLSTHAYDDPTSRRIRRLGELERLGTVMVVVADLSDDSAVTSALDTIEAQVGHIDGAVHAAGAIRDRLLELAEPVDHRYVAAAKAGGALALQRDLAGRNADLLVLVSSTSTVLAPEGQTSYVAANAVLDAMVGVDGTLRTKTINFGLWSEIGIASEAGRRSRLGLGDGDRISHPVFDELVARPDGTIEFVGRIAADTHWLVDEHRTADGRAVMPATGHVELMLAAVELAGVESFSIQSAAFLSPLLVSDDTPSTVRVTVEQGERAAVTIESDGGTGDSWFLHSQAVVASRRTDERSIEHVRLSVEPGADSLHSDDPLDRLRRHMRIGPRWDTVEWASAADGVASAHLALAEAFAHEVGGWRAHPALVDASVAVAVTLSDPDLSDRLFVPIGMGSVELVGPVPPSVRVEATRTASSSPDVRPDVLVVDIALFDDDGRAVLRLERVELLSVGDDQALIDVAHDVDSVVDTVAADADAPLIALADELGLRRDDGVALVERLVGGPHDRIIGSSIDIDALRDRIVDVDQADGGGGAAAPTAAGLEDAIRSIWGDLLGVSGIDDHDDFFELGGHSLIAIRLLSRIGRDLDVRLQLADLFEGSTIAGLAKLVREQRPNIDATFASVGATSDVVAATTTTAERAPDVAAVAEQPAQAGTARLVSITTSGDQRPFYVVHGAGGGVLFLWGFAREFAGERPVYAFQAQGIRNDEEPDQTIEQMATRYVAELRAHSPGPYLLGGYSGGGLIALEMTRLLRDGGDEVDKVVLFDSVPPGKAFPERGLRWRRAFGHIRAKGLDPVKPYIHAQLKRRLDMLLLGGDGQMADAQLDDSDFIDLFEHFGNVVDRYDATHYDVDALLVKADNVWPTQPDDYHWRPHVDRPLEVVTVAGDHQTMFHPENAANLAQVVRQYLDDAG